MCDAPFTLLYCCLLAVVYWYAGCLLVIDFGLVLVCLLLGLTNLVLALGRLVLLRVLFVFLCFGGCLLFGCCLCLRVGGCGCGWTAVVVAVG